MKAPDLTLVRLVSEDPRSVASRLAEQAGITRQAASARLRRAMADGLITRSGTGAGVRYLLAPLAAEGRGWRFSGVGLPPFCIASSCASRASRSSS